MLKSILLVGAGSFVGGALRYVISLLVRPSGGFPLSTFIVNIAGCLLIGLLYGLFSRFSSTSGSLHLRQPLPAFDHGLLRRIHHLLDFRQ